MEGRNRGLVAQRGTRTDWQRHEQEAKLDPRGTASANLSGESPSPGESGHDQIVLDRCSWAAPVMGLTQVPPKPMRQTMFGDLTESPGGDSGVTLLRPGHL